MSDDTADLSARVQHAIQQHLTERDGGGFPTEFLLVANYIDTDGDSAYMLACSPDEVLSATLGLLRWATLAVEGDARRYFAQADDE